MKKHLLLLVLVALVNLTSIQVFYAQAVQNKDTEEIRRKLVKILQDDNNRVKVSLKNGETVKGDITAVDIDFFTILESKTNNSRSINFADMKKVKQTTKFKAKDSLWIAGLGVMVLAIIKGGN